eukprot:gene17522-5471_t
MSTILKIHQLSLGDKTYVEHAGKELVDGFHLGGLHTIDQKNTESIIMEEHKDPAAPAGDDSERNKKIIFSFMRFLKGVDGVEATKVESVNQLLAGMFD